MGGNIKPLAGIRLIELANYVAAPIVGRIAADLGAEVGHPVRYGEHNRAVLADLGYTEAQIDEIIAKGALS